MSNSHRSRVFKKAIVGSTAMATIALQGSLTSGATTTSIDSVSSVINESEVKNTNIFEVHSNYPGIPYFYYWTSGDDVYLNWDYGNVANRPSKIEAIISKNEDFSNPSYIEVKPKGATFRPNIEGNYYLRVRFFDSSGNITHESIRKVIRGAEQTRDIKGLKYEVVGTDIKLSWANFVEGIKSAKIYVDDKLFKTLSSSDLKGNSYVLSGVKGGSEVRISIINGIDLEYNGFVKIDKDAFVKSELIDFRVSNDGAGILIDLSKTSFNSGDEFLINIKEKESNEDVLTDYKVSLSDNSKTITVYPNEGLSFLSNDYVITIKDVKTGDVYTYDYTHILSGVNNFTLLSNGGEIVLSWTPSSNTYQSEVLWSTKEDFSSYESIGVAKGVDGLAFNSNLSSGSVYVILTNYDQNGRVISQQAKSVNINTGVKDLKNFKGVYKGDTSAEFSYDKIDNTLVSGIVKINDSFIALSKDQINTLNSTNSLTLGGFNKNTKYNVSFYLLDKDNNLYKSSISSISLESNNESQGSLEITLPNGISASYILNPGILSLVLDENIYSVSPNSSINVTIDSKSVPNVFGVYVKESNGINIKGLIPEKEYKNVLISYEDKSGNSKNIAIESILIKKGSSLDSFLINAYNKAVSRSTQNIDEEGYNYWKNGLLSKNIGLSYFIRNLSYVPEFMSLINSPSDLITRLYGVLVLRDPDPQGMQFWTSVYNGLIEKGVSHTEATMKILTDMTTSSEFSNLAERLGVNP